MKRVLIVGSGGSGKSTFSLRLGRLLQLPVIHLDALYWNPGWVEPDQSEWAIKVRRALEQDSWILDGNYSGTLAQRIECCDTIIFLDVPRLICAWRVLKRMIRHRGKTRADMAAGCPEKFNFSFLLWIWSYPNRSRRRVLELIEHARTTKTVVHLRTRDEVETFLRTRCESHDR